MVNFPVAPYWRSRASFHHYVAAQRLILYTIQFPAVCGARRFSWRTLSSSLMLMRHCRPITHVLFCAVYILSQWMGVVLGACAVTHIRLVQIMSSMALYTLSPAFYLVTFISVAIAMAADTSTLFDIIDFFSFCFIPRLSSSLFGLPFGGLSVSLAIYGIFNL